MTLPAVSVSQTPEEKFREYLASRPRPQRFTEQQRAMVQHIFSHHEHFDADQLCDQLKEKGLNVSRPTVYRTLTKLVDAGLLRCLETGPRKLYEHSYGYPHHYQMQCQKCESMIEFESETVENLVREICQQHNFNASSHTFIIQGICGECNRAKVNKRRLDMI